MTGSWLSVPNCCDVGLTSPTRSLHGITIWVGGSHGDASLPAEVGLSPNGQGGFQLDATLRVTLPDTIAPDAARALVEATYQVCPYSNANRGNIPVQLIIRK